MAHTDVSPACGRDDGLLDWEGALFSPSGRAGLRHERNSGLYPERVWSMSDRHIPTIEQFLAAPVEQVAEVAPATLIFAAGGTRRSAALSGLSPQSDDYAYWSRDRMIACVEL